MTAQPKKILILILGVLLLIVILFKAGVLTNPFALASQGAVVLNGISATEHVFVDNVVVESQRTTGGRLIYVTPGKRDVLISKEGYWPWLKQVSVEKGQAVQLSPFFFKQQPTLEEIKQDDAEYDALVALTENKPVPETLDILVSSKKTVTIWKKGNTLFAQWIGEGDPPSFFCDQPCDSIMEFWHIATPLSQILFWGNRDDVVIVVLDHSIFALELDRKPVQNFQKIYEGKNQPRIGSTRDGSLYLYEDGRLYHLTNK